MAEGQFLFGLDYTEFYEAWSQKNLSKLQQKFDTSPVNLSQSLLISEETDGIYWLLVDFENEKAYSIRKENETTVEISEKPDMGKGSDFLCNAGPIHPRLESGIGTHTGIIDALKRLNFDKLNVESLKRSDLSARKLSFESVYPDLEVAYKMLDEILAAPRDALVSLSSQYAQQLKVYVLESYEMTGKIIDFGIGGKDENIREQHHMLLQEIHQFSEGVKQSLLHVAAYLSSRTVEQLKDEFKNTVTGAEEKFNKAISEEVGKLQKIGAEINGQQAEVLQKSEEKLKEIEQTHLEYQNQLTEKPISQYKAIFTDQAQQHRKTASRWLLATSGLSVVFVVLFVWLLSDVVPADDNTPVILSVLVTKGFFLSLVFFLLNRTIKNFTAEKHLQVINTHRQNALETFDTFVAAAEGNRETRDAVLLAATRAIFEANQTGYLSAKTSSSDTANPVQQIIKEVIPSKSSTDSD